MTEVQAFTDMGGSLDSYPLGCLYRYEGRGFGDGEWAIELKRFGIKAQTDKTYVIDTWMGDKRVLKGDGKRFAYERKEWAWYSFRKRNARYCQYLQRNLQYATAIAKYILENQGKPPEDTVGHRRKSSGFWFGDDDGPQQYP